MFYVCLLSATAGVIASFFFDCALVVFATLGFVVVALAIATYVPKPWLLFEIYLGCVSLQVGYVVAGLGFGVKKDVRGETIEKLRH